MKQAVRPTIFLSLSVFIVSFISFLPRAVLKASTPATGGQARSSPRPVSGRRDFINYRDEAAVGCRDASEDDRLTKLDVRFTDT